MDVDSSRGSGGRLGALASFAVRRPVAVSMLFVALSLLGVLSYRGLPVQLVPDFALPTVYVTASWPGAAPEAVEKDVVLRLEGELATLSGVKEIQAVVSPGSASVEVAFERGVNLDLALLEVRQRLGGLRGVLPETADVSVERFDTARFTNFVMVLSLRGTAEPQDLRRVADDDVVPVLSSVQGVVLVNVLGGASLQVATTVDPDRARAQGSSVLAVRAALAGVSQPVLAVGTVDDGPRSLPVVLDGRARTLKDVTEAPVRGTSRTRLGDVAEVQLALASGVERYRVDRLNSLGLVVFKDQTANLLQVAQDLRAAVTEWNAERADGGLKLAIDTDGAEPIEESLGSLFRSGLVGAGLGLLVLLAFLGDLKPLVAVALAVPVSLLSACDLFAASGMTLNLLSLLGLALAVGLLVDNSVIVLEAIAVRREKGDDPVTAAGRGAASVARAVIASTSATLVVFLPLAFLDWEFAPLLEEVARAVAFPMAASLVVSLVLVPVLASRLPPQQRGNPVRLPGAFGRPRPGVLRCACSAVLRLCLRSAGLTLFLFLLGITISLVIAVPLVVLFVEAPRPSAERIQLRARMATGASVDTTDAIARQFEALTQDLPEVEQVQTSVRETEATVTIVFKPPDERERPVDIERIRARLREQAPQVTGARTIDVDPPQETQGGVGGGLANTGGTRETVRVGGPPDADLAGGSRLIMEQLQRIPGVIRVETDLAPPRPTLEIRPDRRRLAAHGLSTRDLLAVVWATRREGEPMRHGLFLGDEEIALVLWVAGGSTRTADEIRSFPLLTSTGARVPLEAVASVSLGLEPPILRRWQRDRTVTLTYGIDSRVAGTGEEADAVRAAVDRVLAETPLAEGIHALVEHADSSTAEMKRLLVLAFALVFLVLAICFESFILPVLVMFCVPLAAVGAVWALVLTGTSVNEMVVLAFAVLIGISVNNGILFTDRVQELRLAGAPLPAAVLRAWHHRLRPMLMTAGTTIVGMLPLAVSRGGEQEIWPPFGRAVIGGLLAATLISLVFLPAGALALGRLEELVRRLGLRLVALATVVTAALAWWGYFEAEIVISAPMRWLLPVPAWIGCLVLTRAAQALARGERAPVLVLPEGPVQLVARRLRKVYGGLPRVLRDATLEARWIDDARRAGLSPAQLDPPRVAVTRLACLAGGLGLSVSLVALAEGAWGRLILALPVPVLASMGLRALLAAFGRPDAFPPRGWAGRALHAAFTLAPWGLAFASRRAGSAADVVVLVLFGLVLVPWAVAHLVVEGGLLALLRRRVAPTAVVALAGVDLQFTPGLYGLLGPNGAGKSTLMRLVVNLFRPTRGQVTINGHEVMVHAASLQSVVGYLPQFFAVPPRLTAREYLHHHGLLSGKTDPQERERLVDEALAQVGLAERADEQLGGYSGGMRQRVGIARTLLDAPRILVVDEPTVGLDPRERVRFRNLLGELSRTRIVLLSTHVVEDIGAACREVIVLARGRVAFRGAPAELADLARGQAFALDLAEDAVAAAGLEHRLVSTVASGPGRVRARCVGPPPPGAELLEPTLEDGYLLLLSEEGGGRRVA